jgi:RNA polymerase sigma-70 factor, ECF subfamily
MKRWYLARHESQRRMFARGYMTLPSDATLVPLLRRAQSHDPRAFDQVYDLFADLVFRYAYLSSGSAPFAETVVNDVFVKLVGSIGSVRLPRRDLAHAVVRWLFEAAQVLLRQHRSSNGSQPSTLIAGATERQLAPDFALAAAVQHLAPEQQQIVVLRYVERLSLGDVATITGLSPAVLKELQHRALAAITIRPEYSPKMPEAW